MHPFYAQWYRIEMDHPRSTPLCTRYCETKPFSNSLRNEPVQLIESRLILLQLDVRFLVVKSSSKPYKCFLLLSYYFFPLYHSLGDLGANLRTRIVLSCPVNYRLRAFLPSYVMLVVWTSQRFTCCDLDSLSFLGNSSCIGYCGGKAIHKNRIFKGSTASF